MNIPIVKATNTPPISELQDPARAWAIVRCVDGRSYIGRVSGRDEQGFLILLDPFDYGTSRSLVGDPNSPRVAMQRQIFPCEHFDVASILLMPSSILALCKLSPRALESLREAMIQAWDGREHLKANGGRLELASSSTKISPVGA